MAEKTNNLSDLTNLARPVTQGHSRRCQLGPLSVQSVPSCTPQQFHSPGAIENNTIRHSNSTIDFVDPTQGCAATFIGCNASNLPNLPLPSTSLDHIEEGNYSL